MQYNLFADISHIMLTTGIASMYMYNKNCDTNKKKDECM